MKRIKYNTKQYNFKEVICNWFNTFDLSKLHFIKDYKHFERENDQSTIWHKTYYDRLLLYFENDYLVKDDQILLIDCAFTYPGSFQLYRENFQHFDNWFMFQRIFS